MQKAVRGVPIDRMWPVEELNLCQVSNAEFVVMPSHFGKLPGNPFIDPDTVVVSAFNHERPRRHQDRQFCVIGNVPHVPFKDFVFSCPQITEWRVN